jgi:hypothetical protein
MRLISWLELRESASSGPVASFWVSKLTLRRKSVNYLDIRKMILNLNPAIFLDLPLFSGAAGCRDEGG